METELLGVLVIKNKLGELVAVVHRDEKSKHQVFYAVKEMGVDDIKQLLNTKD